MEKKEGITKGKGAEKREVDERKKERKDEGKKERKICQLYGLCESENPY